MAEQAGVREAAAIPISDIKKSLSQRPRVAILGTGLIGTSMGLVLAAQKNRPFEIIGMDLDRGRAREAKKLGAIDRDVGSYRDAITGSNLVIIAVPVLAAREIFETVGREFADGAVVTDVCSTKADVIRWAEDSIDPSVNFVGGHPMTGSEKSGPKAASAELFQGAIWALIPSARASEGAVKTIEGLVGLTGATPIYYDAAEHDTYVAAVSQMPILLSVALFNMLRESPAWEDAAMLAGPAFKDLTRLASGSPTMSGDIMDTNREAVLHWVDRFREQLAQVSEAVQAGGDPMADLFVKANLDRDTFIEHRPVRRPPAGPKGPSAQDQIWRLFAGGLYDRYKETAERMERGELRDDKGLKRKLGGKDRGR